MPDMARYRRLVGVGAAALGLTMGAAAVANAATSTSPTAPPSSEQDDVQDPVLNGSIQVPETAEDHGSEAQEAASLQGLAKISRADAEAAAAAAVPGGSIVGSELGNENGTLIYEVDMTDASGAAVELKVDAGNGSVLATESGDDDHDGSESDDDRGSDEAPEADEAPQSPTAG